MDRRMFLAFVLIFLILTGYPVLMQKFFPAPAPRQIEAVQEDGVADTADAPDEIQVTGSHGTGFEPPAAGSFDLAAPDITTAADALRFVDQPAERTVTVRTPLYELEISTKGGRIVSWKSFAYDSWEGGPVQLIPRDIPAVGSDAILFRGADLDLGSVVYSADRQIIDLSGSGGSASLVLSAPTAGGLEIRKIFTFHPDLYGMEVDFVVAAAGDPGPALALTGAPDKVRFGWNQGLAPTERIQRLEDMSMRAVAKIGEDLQFKKLQDLKKSEEKVSGLWTGSVRFAGLQTRYFTATGIVPQEQGEPVEGTIRLGGDQERLIQSWTIEVPVRRGMGEEIAQARLDLFVGPQEAELLQSYGQGLEKSMELGWKLFRPLAEVVLWGMELMHRFIPNYGLIIIVFSILTKLMFYPLTKTSTQSMKKMQEIQPKMKALQEKYKNDKDKLNQEMMKLYREEKVNPAAGCLPLLVQSPVFIALYQALNHTISLRGQPFVLWIDDLSQPDAIAQLPFSLPFLGSDLNLLPILMAAATYFQTKLTPTSGAGGQMAMMNAMMPLIMIFFFYNMPSGLVLYWLVNTILQGYQMWQIHRTAAPAGEGAQVK
ncbi:MAG: membrane protein insertase YidC [bacterium]